MVKRNRLFVNHPPDLFYEIGHRKAKLLEREPKAKVINLGVGDTSTPLCEPVLEALIKEAKAQASYGSYQGYPPTFGHKKLREAISEKVYQGRILPDEIFISDGAKSDLGRLQHLFSADTTIAFQDPAYPAYEMTSWLSGKRNRVVRLPILPSNDFFPDLEISEPIDLLYICSPNNPTGAFYDKAQLKKILDFARKKQAILIFDAAYFSYVKEGEPRSIYELEGAKEIAIEINSFSKLAGFTGLRAGWSVVPHALCFEDGTSVQKDWMQVIAAFFNGVSHVSQAAALAALSKEGLAASTLTCSSYLENASLLKKALEAKGFSVYGGSCIPYLWVDLKGKSSWKIFDELLERAHLLTTPGVGFGQYGEGFLRLSGFGPRDQLLEGIERLNDCFF